MTTQARIVLEDCREALRYLKSGPRGNDWRRSWVTAVALLRTVGYVLYKVDSEQSPEMKETINEAWESWKENPVENKIFFEFIEQERNNVLKEYRFSAQQDTHISGSLAHIDGKTGKQSTAIPARPTEYFYPMNSGPYEGQDQREVVAMAIIWWEEQINEIDIRAAAKLIEDRL